MVAADQRAAELDGGAPPGRVEDELDGDALARLPRHQAAEVAAQRRRQHRLGEQRQVQARGAAPRLALDLAVVVHEVRDVGDVHVGAVPVALARDRDGVVEVARGVRVDGEGRERREVAAAVVRARGARAHRGRLLQHGVGEALAHALRVQQRPQHGLDVVGAAQDLDDPAAVAVHRHGEDQLVEPGRRPALGDQIRAGVGEQGLQRPELAPAGDAVREWPGAIAALGRIGRPAAARTAATGAFAAPLPARPVARSARAPRGAHDSTSLLRRCTAAPAAERRPSWSWACPGRRCRA